MNIEQIKSIDEVKNLLASLDLPTEDLAPLTSVKFFGVLDVDSLVAVVGLELYGKVGLLRSLAVLPSRQTAGMGKQLVRHAEAIAMQYEVEKLYLLTTTAEAFFKRLAYQPALREGAPEPIRATSQFSGLCPASSAFLMKQLN